MDELHLKPNTICKYSKLNFDNSLPSVYSEKFQFDETNFFIVPHFVSIEIEEVDPTAYEEEFGDELISYEEMPEFLKQIEAPKGLTLAIHSKHETPLLYGDTYALRLIDLTKEELEEYRFQVEN